jgi:hypothetical protein
MIKNNKTLDWVVKELLKGNKIKNDILYKNKLSENYSFNEYNNTV